jgi:glutamate-1-semialdehyde 2,1-aminomutase
MTDAIAGIDPDRLTAFAAREAAVYAKARPKSAKALADRAGVFLGGVPMHWMADWPMPHLPLVAKATGAQIEDIDGHRLDDFCLGDTGSMFGHSPASRRESHPRSRPAAASPTCCRPRQRLRPAAC